MRPQSREKKIQLSLSVSPALKAELEAEAWESQMTLTEYVRGLLTRRGKWARSVGKAGGYDIGPPGMAPTVRRYK